MSELLAYLQELNMASMMLRIILAMVVGGILGIERERKGRAAGFRTYMLVAMGATLTVILSQYTDLMLSTRWAATAEQVGIKTDLSRFGAQVINGVGFLGAGTIIVTGRQEVKGLTTAAGLWASACIGIAIGAGFYEGVLVGTLLIIISMKLLPLLENVMLRRTRNMNIYIGMDSMEHLGAVVSFLRSRNVQIFDVDLSKEKLGGVSHINALLSIKLARRMPHSEVLAKIATMNGIISIEEI